MLPDRLKGLFLELRAIPVLLWSVTAITLGTGVGAVEGGRLDPWAFLEALLIGVLIQGYATHAVNEIYDWRSGTDGDPSPRVLSGGSRVLLARLLGERELWAIFAGSSVLLWALAVDLASRTGPAVLALTGIGYLAGVLYTLPPVSTSYRPFAGEWLGGFLGVLCGGLGGAYAQAQRITALSVAVAAAHACVCVGMLLMHHYLDVSADRNATPPKRTTIVLLGPRGGKAYANSFAASALVLGSVLAIAWRIDAVVFAAAAAVGLFAHLRAEPASVVSTTRNELLVIQAGILGGLLLAGLLSPPLFAIAPVAGVLYIAHVRAAQSVRTPAAARFESIAHPPA